MLAQCFCATLLVPENGLKALSDWLLTASFPAHCASRGQVSLLSLLTYWHLCLDCLLSPHTGPSKLGKGQAH